MIRFASTSILLLCMALQALVSGRPMSGEGVERVATRVSDVFNDVGEDYYRWAGDGTHEGLDAYRTEDLRPSRSYQRGMHDAYHGWTRPDQPVEAYPERHGHYLGQHAQQPGWSRPSHRAQDLGQPRPDARGWPNPSGSRPQPGRRAPRSHSRDEGGISSKMLYYASATQVKFDQGRGPSLPSRPSFTEPSTSRRAPVPGSDGATSSWAGEADGSSQMGGAAGGSSSTTPRFRQPEQTASVGSSSSAVRVPHPGKQVTESIDNTDLPLGFEDIAAMDDHVFEAKIKDLTKAELLRVGSELFRARTSMPRKEDLVTVRDHRSDERLYSSPHYVYASSKQSSVFLEIVKRMINAKPTDERITATLTIDPRSKQYLSHGYLDHRVGMQQRYEPPKQGPFYVAKHPTARLYPFVLGDYEVYISDTKSSKNSESKEVLYSAFAFDKGLVATRSFKKFRLENRLAYGIMFGYLKFPETPKVTPTFLFKKKGAGAYVPAPPETRNRRDTPQQRIMKKLGM